jgi:phage tail-like protein
MADFTLNPSGYDPYKNFKFRLKWDGKVVAGASKVSTLKRTAERAKRPGDGDLSSGHKSPGRTEYEAITLERGVTHDPVFEQWANKGSQYSALPGSGTALANFRKELTLEVYNETGELAIAYHIHRCWVSEFQALPALDASANAVAIERLKIESEGWERDPGVFDPTETSGRTPLG